MQSMTTITTGTTTLPAGLKEYYKVVVSPETLSHIIGTKTAFLNIALANDPCMTSPDKKRYNKFVRELNEMLTVWIKQNHSSSMRDNVIYCCSPDGQKLLAAYERVPMLHKYILHLDMYRKDSIQFILQDRNTYALLFTGTINLMPM